jgi:integrase
LRDRQQTIEGSEISGSTTLGALADEWLSRGHDANGKPWASNTADTYRYIVENEVKKALGGVRLSELRVAAINRALRAIAERNGPGAAKTAKTVLSGMCKLAISYEAIDTNPVRDAQSIGQGEKDPVRALTRAEVEQMGDLLRSHGRALELDLPDLVDWMLATGCRIGEACAARDEVLDLDAGTWEINATLVRVTGKGLVIQRRPKTAAGWRVLALPPFAVTMVRRRAGELRLRTDDRVLFGAPKAKALRDPSNTSGDLREVFDQLGCSSCGGRGWHEHLKTPKQRATPPKRRTDDDGNVWNLPCDGEPPFAWLHSHVFRKTVATRLDDAGLSPRMIADQLGHAKPSMTQDVYMGRKVVSAEAARLLDR